MICVVGFGMGLCSARWHAEYVAWLCSARMIWSMIFSSAVLPEFARMVARSFMCSCLSVIPSFRAALYSFDADLRSR